MELTIFAKKRTSREGKPYYIYVGRLPKKTGEQVPVRVKFRESAGNPNPKDCPMNIMVSRDAMNLRADEFTREDTGEVGTAYTLWVSAWKEGAPFVDTSLDEFDIT